MVHPTLIPWRRRTDLVVRARREEGGGGFVLKDPIALRYFQLGEDEHFIWSRLDGCQSVEALCAAFADGFRPRRLAAEELQRFLAQLIGQGLVLGDQLGVASLVEQRRERQQWWQTLAVATNILAIRFRGIDPDRWLTRLLPWVAWLITPAALAAFVLLWCSAIGLWIWQAGTFAQRWPEEAAQWTVQDLTTMAAVVAVLKVLHELAHGLTCKKFGGHVPELGVMLLVFTPCLYCNVSDVWLLRSRWQRIAVSAAGMIVEAAIAAVALWLWWASAPGPFHGLCLQVAFLCGVSTLLFNINPLLRYDGYYILADAMNVPNLQSQATAALWRCVRPWLTGVSEPPVRGMTAKHEAWLAAYAAAALVNRVAVVVGILWVLQTWLEPQGFGVFAKAAAIMTVLTLSWGLLLSMTVAIKDRDTRDLWFHPFSLARTIAAIGAAGLLLFVPLPHRVIAPALLEPADARSVYVTIPGHLPHALPFRPAVAAAEALATLSNPTATRQLARSEADVTRAAAREAALERRRIFDPAATLQLPASRQSRQDLHRQWTERQAEAARLTLAAPTAGAFWPAADRPSLTMPERLPGWSGSLAEDRNQGCWLDAGAAVGVIASPDRFEAIAYLPQQAVVDVRVGQTVRVLLDADPGRAVTGRLSELASAQTASLEPGVSARLKLPTTIIAGENRLVGPWYRARIALNSATIPPIRHLAGTAVIAADRQTLAQRARRWFDATFPQR